jgi:MoaA/NifB/PqqE/SkfB family radical SAM enzyme
MNLTGIHFLLTYKCIFRCDHCFVWGSPFAEGTMKLKDIRSILAEAKKLDTLEMICFEGGEPFLYYPILVKALREAKNLGFNVGIVSDCYWATSFEDAREWLLPIAEIEISGLSLSGDVYHGDTIETEQLKNAVKAAKSLGISVSILSIEPLNGDEKRPDQIEGIPVGYYELMCKGRAASKLVDKASLKPWTEFNKCPFEELEDQKRVHIDFLGYVHVCQGIAIGNALKQPLSEIINSYNPKSHPIVGPLIRKGPIGLVEKYGLSHDEAYADACHFCYNLRLMLRSKFPDILAPDQMYGVGLEE